MFFNINKRRWALRVTEEMGLPTRSPEATELVEMIIQGAKQHNQMARSAGLKFSDPELVLMSVSAMKSNQSALRRLVDYVRLTPEQAYDLLKSAHRAGRALAVKEGYTKMIDAMYDSAEAMKRPA